MSKDSKPTASKPAAKAAPAPDPVPLTESEKKRQIAVINQRHQAGEITALEAQGLIDDVNAGRQREAQAEVLVSAGVEVSDA